MRVYTLRRETGHLLAIGLNRIEHEGCRLWREKKRFAEIGGRHGGRPSGTKMIRVHEVWRGKLRLARRVSQIVLAIGIKPAGRADG